MQAARGGAQRFSNNSIKFRSGRRLVLADTASGDVCLEIIFAPDGQAGNAAKNGELSDVIESVGERTLKEFFR